MAIFKGDFNARYGNTATWTAFSIQDTVINSITEVSSWIIIEPCLLSGKPLILSATLLNRYSDMILLFFKKGIGLKLVHVPFSNCTGRWGQTPEFLSIVFFNLVYMIVLRRMSSFLSWYFSPILFNSGSPLSVFCDLRICTAYLYHLLSSTNVCFHLK